MAFLENENRALNKINRVETPAKMIVGGFPVPLQLYITGQFRASTALNIPIGYLLPLAEQRFICAFGSKTIYILQRVIEPAVKIKIGETVYTVLEVTNHKSGFKVNLDAEVFQKEGIYEIYSYPVKLERMNNVPELGFPTLYKLHKDSYIKLFVVGDELTTSVGKAVVTRCFKSGFDFFVNLDKTVLSTVGEEVNVQLNMRPAYRTSGTGIIKINDKVNEPFCIDWAETPFIGQGQVSVDLITAGGKVLKQITNCRKNEIVFNRNINPIFMEYAEVTKGTVIGRPPGDEFNLLVNLDERGQFQVVQHLFPYWENNDPVDFEWTSDIFPNTLKGKAEFIGNQIEPRWHIHSIVYPLPTQAILTLREPGSGNFVVGSSIKAISDTSNATGTVMAWDPTTLTLTLGLISGMLFKRGEEITQGINVPAFNFDTGSIKYRLLRQNRAIVLRVSIQDPAYLIEASGIISSIKEGYLDTLTGLWVIDVDKATLDLKNVSGLFIAGQPYDTLDTNIFGTILSFTPFIFNGVPDPSRCTIVVSNTQGNKFHSGETINQTSFYNPKTNVMISEGVLVTPEYVHSLRYTLLMPKRNYKATTLWLKPLLYNVEG